MKQRKINTLTNPCFNKAAISKAVLPVIFLLLSCHAFVSAQKLTMKAELLKLTSRSDSISYVCASEKPYLQLDKPYYAIGDTIWFKAYLLKSTTLIPSAKSGILYIDIATDSGKIVKRYSIPVAAGFSWGDLPLGDKDFSPGTYILRAYTSWMRNFGDDYFFYKRFYVAGAGEKNWQVKKQVSEKNNSDTANVRLQFSQANGTPEANKPLKLQVFAGNKHLYRQTIQTDQNGLMDFNIKFPEKNAVLMIKAANTPGDKSATIPITLNRPENADVQFLPGGGSLIAGLPAHIGFKAIGADGKGIDISGVVTDQDQKQAAAFKSVHNGMGSFDMAVTEGGIYTAKVTLPGGIVKVFPLPAVKTSGTTLSVMNPFAGDSLAVSVDATNDLKQQGESYFLVGKARGIVCYAAIVNFKDGSFVRRKIPKGLFPTGITHFILTTETGRPLNERLVFIDHDDLRIQLIAAPANDDRPDSVALQIKATNSAGEPVKGNFSLSVTNSALVKPDSLNNENILSRLLLSSDLKGHVEGAGYYLLSKTAEAWQALDNLLLTQGWIGYDWNQAANTPVIAFQPEHEFTVKGSVVNMFSKPVKGTDILLFSKSPAILMDTATDKDGRFVFSRFPKVDTPIFVLKAVNKKGKSFNVHINVDEVKAPAFAKSNSLLTDPWYVNSDTALLNYAKNNLRAKELEYYPEGGHILKEVQITAKKIIADSQNLNGPGNADLVLDEKDLEAAGKKTWLQLLQENLKGFREGFFPFNKTGAYLDLYVTDYQPDTMNHEWYFIGGKPVKLIVDGLSVNQIIDNGSFRDMTDYLQTHSAEDIKGLEVMGSTKYAMAYLYRYNPLNPLTSVDLISEAESGYIHIGPSDIAYVEITTRSGHGPIIDNTPGMYLYKPLPISWPKQFYKPRYTVKDTANHIPDMRSTIDWEPNINTDTKGDAIVSFFSAGKPSTYTVIIEGTDMNGNFVYRSAQISTGKAIEKSK